MIFFAVALGGALGAVGRYGISLIPLKTVFPYLTFGSGAVRVKGWLVFTCNSHKMQ